MQHEYPEATARTVFRLFGHGSEALGLDDEHSRDHHWRRVFTEQREEILQMPGANMPETFQGRELGKSTREGAGA